MKDANMCFLLKGHLCHTCPNIFTRTFLFSDTTCLLMQSSYETHSAQVGNDEGVDYSICPQGPQAILQTSHMTSLIPLVTISFNQDIFNQYCLVGGSFIFYDYLYALWVGGSGIFWNQYVQNSNPPYFHWVGFPMTSA